MMKQLLSITIIVILVVSIVATFANSFIVVSNSVAYPIPTVTRTNTPRPPTVYPSPTVTRTITPIPMFRLRVPWMGIRHIH